MATTNRAAETDLMGAIRAEREARDRAPVMDESKQAAAPAPEPEEVETVDTEPESEARAAPEAPETEEAEETPETTQETAPESEADADTIEVSDVPGLAAYLGLDASDLYEIEVPATVGGEKRGIKLGELKDSYVAVQEAQRLQAEAKEARERVEAEVKAQREQIAQNFEASTQILNGIEQQVLKRYQSIDWDTLRREEPAEWTAKRTEAEQAARALHSAKAHVAESQRKAMEEQTAAEKVAMSERLGKEREALLAVWPEFESSEEERTRLLDHFRGRGYSDQEIDGISDHRQILDARDARRWRESQKQTDATRKKVMKIQKKVLQPGAAQKKSERSQSSVTRAVQRLKKSGHHRDFAALLGEWRRNS